MVRSNLAVVRSASPFKIFGSLVPSPNASVDTRPWLKLLSSAYLRATILSASIKVIAHLCAIDSAVSTLKLARRAFLKNAIK